MKRTSCPPNHCSGSVVIWMLFLAIGVWMLLPAGPPPGPQSWPARHSQRQQARWSFWPAGSTPIAQPGPDGGVQQRWNEALKLLTDRKLDEAIAAFRALLTELPEDSQPYGAAVYNIACAYSLKGDKRNGALWLARSARVGFRDAAQIHGDSDLDNIRNEPLVKKIIDQIENKRFDELDALDIDALDKQFYGPGAPAQPTPTQPGPALSDEQKRKLEALRQEMYAEIEKELDATRARLRKLVDETIARMAASATPEDPAPTTPPATGSVPFLGIVLRELDDDFRAFTGIPAGQGMGVDSFDDGSPAPAAGVQKMDVLMKADGQPIGSQATLDKLVAAKKPGDVIVLELIRDGRVTIRVTLAGKAGRVEDGRPAWAYTPAHVAGESFAGIGRGATEADAARSASENLIAAASVVARQAARRYMLTTLHAQQQKVSESYLGEIMYSSIPPLHDKVRILRKEAAAGHQWAQASLPFQALVESLANGLRATYRRIDGPNVDEQKLRLLVREEHDKLIAAGGSAMTDTTPTPTPTPTPGERLPALGNGVLGLRVAGTDDGVEVRDVTPGSPADTAGIRAGDVIVTIDGQAVTTNNALRDVLEKRFVGDTLKLTVQRAGRTLNLNLTIGKRD